MDDCYIHISPKHPIMPHINLSSFKGNKYFKGKHLETIVPALFRHVDIKYKRTRLELADTDFIDLDWLIQPSSKLIVLFHGLEGSSDSEYIKGFARSFSLIGWDICAVNFRSCSGDMNRLARSYHSGATEDIDEILQAISKTHTYKNILLGGFSLGGNMLLKYLGEKKYNIPAEVVAAFAFSVPCDLRSSALQMAKWENTLYMKRFLQSLYKKMQHKSLQFEEFPSIHKLTSIRTFHQFDDQFNAPVHGFKNAEDYYSQCNSLQFLSSIATPTLLVNALNDPFLTESCFPVDIAKSHPFLYLETPSYGGHVGFSEGLPNENYWSETRVRSFISTFGF
jgi:predicted alpha/beta-fold hydrolase